MDLSRLTRHVAVIRDGATGGGAQGNAPSAEFAGPRRGTKRRGAPRKLRAQKMSVTLYAFSVGKLAAAQRKSIFSWRCSRISAERDAAAQKNNIDEVIGADRRAVPPASEDCSATPWRKRPEEQGHGSLRGE